MNIKKKRIFIANWKMNLSFAQAIQWAINGKQVCIDTQEKTGNSIILCPSFEALAPVIDIFKGTGIRIGAQNCSAFLSGPYTGQISPLSLAQVGCAHSLIGHSECRTAFNETDQDIALKASACAQQGIIPIVCIGENKPEHAQGTSYDVLAKQLNPVFEIYKAQRTPLLIAYEPVWAIGTGMIPDNEYLQTLFAMLRESCQQEIPHTPVSLLYGGSVDEKNSQSLSRIDAIDGFLIGGASLDFQKFNNIVSLSSI